VREAVEALYLSVAVYGVAWIIVKSKLLEGPRDLILYAEVPFLAKLLRCTVCTSVWV